MSIAPRSWRGAGVAQALKLWRTINLVNLKKNILPTRKRANLILKQGRGASRRNGGVAKL